MARPFLFFREKQPGLLAALILAMTVGGFYGSTQVGFDDVPANLFRTEDLDFKILDEVRREFTTDENDSLIVVQSEDLFTPKSLAALRELSREIRKVDRVDKVLGFVDIPVFDGGVLPKSIVPPSGAPPAAYEKARKLAAEHPLIGDVLVSSDSTTALIVVALEGKDLAVEEMNTILGDARVIVGRIAEDAGFRFWFTGIPPIRVAIMTSMRRDQAIFTIAGATVSAVVSFFLFRSFFATCVVALGPLIGLLWTFGILGLLGIELNPITSVLPTLILVIGYTDSVHLGLDIGRNRAEGLGRKESVLATIRELALPCGLTSVTTAVGFGSLMTARIESIERLGLVTAIGSVTTLLSVLTVVPLLAMTKLGDPLARRRRLLEADGSATGFWGALSRGLVTKPRRVAVIGTIVTVFLCFVTTGLRPDTRLTESVPSHFEAFHGLVECDERFGGVLEAQVLLTWEDDEQTPPSRLLAAIADVEAALEGNEAISHPLSLLDVLVALPGPKPAVERAASLRVLPKEATSRFYRPDLRKALVRGRVPDLYASEMSPAFQEAKAKFEEVEKKYPGLEIELTGTTVVISEKVKEMIGELVRSLLVAAVVIFAVLAVAFRSIPIALISLVPNVFPLVMTASFIVWMDWPLILASVIVFSVSLGIAVDDTIHYIAAFRRKMLSGMSAEEAARLSFLKIGNALIITTTVFLAGFGCTQLSELDVLRMFGILSCIAIGSAIFGDLLILPALLVWVYRDKAPKAEPGEGDVEKAS